VKTTFTSHVEVLDGDAAGPLKRIFDRVNPEMRSEPK